MDRELRISTNLERDALRILLGTRCAAARSEAGLSQRELAKRLGMSASWVRELESGGQWAPWWLVLQLAEWTGRPLAWFVGGTA